LRMEMGKSMQDTLYRLFTFDVYSILERITGWGIVFYG